VTREELEKVEQMVANASQQGAEIVTGGSRAEVPGFEGGFWYEPTVLVATRNDMEIMQEEIFGPVSPIMAFDDLEEMTALRGLKNTRADAPPTRAGARRPQRT
jgi:acyl-CoA reductase-like NAD-dependent aldehyde dehydrogenase